MSLRQHKWDVRVTFDCMGSSDKNTCSLGTDFKPTRSRRDEDDSRRRRACIERAMNTSLEEKTITFLEKR